MCGANNKLIVNKYKKIYKKDELLYGANDNIENINNLKKQLGTYNFEAQYMQNPKMQDENIIKPIWLNYYDMLPKSLEIYISIDTCRIKLIEKCSD